MRIDMEQFLALTVALGTVGAVGTAVYVKHMDAQAVAAAPADEPTADYPEAPDDPVDAVAVQPPVVAVEAPGPDVVSSELPADEDLTTVPAPYSEGAWMNG